MYPVRWVTLNGWNVHATRFVQPPTWTWDPVPGIARYRIRFAPPRRPAIDADTPEPQFSMAAVWDRLPEGQLDEDFGENAPYENLEHLDADELVRYLVWFRDEIPGAVDIALDIQRWVEDQFVVWQPETSPVPVECITPGVLEQYLCYWPMENYNAYLVMSLMALNQATGDETHLDKAIAIANAVVRSQYENGAFSTWGFDQRFGRPLRTDEWPGANAWTSEALLRWDRYHRAVSDGVEPSRDLLKL